MLETVALCTLLFDLHGLRLSFLPDRMISEAHQELGFDPWSEEAYAAMNDAFAAEQGASTEKALLALLQAEKEVAQMSPRQTLDEVNRCADIYRDAINAR